MSIVIGLDQFLITKIKYQENLDLTNPISKKMQIQYFKNLAFFQSDDQITSIITTTIQNRLHIITLMQVITTSQAKGHRRTMVETLNMMTTGEMRKGVIVCLFDTMKAN